MLVSASVSSLSWIPSEAVRGLLRVPFDLGFAHYDAPPPDRLRGLADLERLCLTDSVRFGHRLCGRVGVQDGAIVEAAYDDSSRGVIGSTTLRLARASARFLGVELPCLRQPPRVGTTTAVLAQTFGGRTAVPMPRWTASSPHLRLTAPTVWTSLVLTLHADGRSEHRLEGASPFPRHWLYAAHGELVAKSGLTDWDTWVRAGAGRTPWGAEDSPALVTAAESALERALSDQVMQQGCRPVIGSLRTGETLMTQGQLDDTIYLVLDGMVAVSVNGRRLVELGPGAVLGERSVLEGGRRTATVLAVTPVRFAAVPAERLDRAALTRLSKAHHREDLPPDG